MIKELAEILFWRCKEVVWEIQLGISVESRLAGQYFGNKVVLGRLCRGRDVCCGEDLPEVDDLECLEL